MRVIDWMRMVRRVSWIATAALSLMAAHSALAQTGDPVRGATLFNTTYKCNGCHTFGVKPIPSGGTVAGLLQAISTVPEMRSRFASTLGNNPTDLADLAAYIAAGNAPALDLDQHGFTGSWFEAATSGQGIELEVFPRLVAVDTAFVQGAWFTFDAGAGGADHQRWYTFDGKAQTGQGSIPITLYQNTGGKFAAPPTTSPVIVGTGTLSFTSCTDGTFSYQFTDGSNRTGSVALTRLTPNVTCAIGAAPVTNADFSYSGNWLDPTTAGQGFVFELNPLSPVLFFTWYTYAPNGQAQGAAGQRWYTGQGGYAPGARVIATTLYETTGGVFDQPTTPPPQTVPVGTATVTFTSCAAAQIDFRFTSGSSAGMTGTIPLVRIGPVPAGCGS